MPYEFIAQWNEKIRRYELDESGVKKDPWSKRVKVYDKIDAIEWIRLTNLAYHINICHYEDDGGYEDIEVLEIRAESLEMD